MIVPSVRSRTLPSKTLHSVEPQASVHDCLLAESTPHRLRALAKRSPKVGQQLILADLAADSRVQLR
jgi:hypothetical protein